MLSEDNWLQNCVYSSSLAGYSPQSRKELDETECTRALTHIHIFFFLNYRNTEFWQVKNDWLWCVMCVCVCVCVQGGGIWGRPFLFALLSFRMFQMCIVGTAYTMCTLTTYSFDNCGGNERLEMLVCISCVHMVYSLLYNNTGNHVTTPSIITERKKQTRL